MAKRDPLARVRVSAVLFCRRLSFDGRFWTFRKAAHVWDAPAFPFTLRTLIVYVRLHDGQPGDSVIVTARLRDLSVADDYGEPTEIATSGTQAPPFDLWRMTDARLPFANLEFFRPGVFDVTIEINGQVVDHATLVVRDKR